MPYHLDIGKLTEDENLELVQLVFPYLSEDQIVVLVKGLPEDTKQFLADCLEVER